MNDPTVVEPFALPIWQATRPVDDGRYEMYQRRRLESSVGERARHAAWSVLVIYGTDLAVVAFGNYHYGHPDGLWQWAYGPVPEDTGAFVPWHLIATAHFQRGTPDGNMRLHHLSRSTRDPGQMQHGAVALEAHFDYGRHAEAWVATDVEGREVWTGDFQADASVHTRIGGVELRSEAAAKQICWIAQMHVHLPEIGAYTSLCKRLVDPIKPALPAVLGPTTAPALSNPQMQRLR